MNSSPTQNSIGVQLKFGTTIIDLGTLRVLDGPGSIIITKTTSGLNIDQTINSKIINIDPLEEVT